MRRNAIAKLLTNDKLKSLHENVGIRRRVAHRLRKEKNRRAEPAVL